MGAFSQHPLQPTAVLNPPPTHIPLPHARAQPCFLSSRFFWFLLISLVNICLSCTIPYFFFLVFLLSPPLDSRSLSAFKNDFGFDAMALGRLQTSLDTGRDHTARPGLTAQRAEAFWETWLAGTRSPDSAGALAVLKASRGQPTLRTPSAGCPTCRLQDF